jgi:hypothetical protein
MWDTMRPIPSLHAEVKDEKTNIFEGVDLKGNVTRERTKATL